MKETYEGESVLRKWLALADSGDLFDCTGSSCHAVVHAYAPSKAEATETLAECDVMAVRGKIGAPESCTPVALLTHETAWLRVVKGCEIVSCDVGRPDYDLNILYRSPLKLNTILKAVNDGLSGHPLKLTMQLTATSAVGTADYRISPILNGWRELVTIRVDAQEGDGHYKPTSGSWVGLILSTTLYVNRQNTDRPEDWHLPSQQQRDVYLHATEECIRDSIESVCKKSKWRDSRTLECGLIP